MRHLERDKPLSLCIVVPENANIALDAPPGSQVHVLDCGTLDADSLRHRYPGVTLKVIRLADVELPSHCNLPELNDMPRMHIRDRVRWVLAELHRRHRFDVIEFSTQGGLGFRVIQAKKCGLDFTDVRLCVSLQAPTQLQRDERYTWLDHGDQLADDYCERYAFEHADQQRVDSEQLAREVRKLGWDLPVESPPPSRPEHVLGLATHGARGLHRPLTTRHTAHSTPLVTVSVAYYNLGAYLPAALESLARQSYQALEVLVINDGSTDAESLRVFEEMRLRYTQFRFYSQTNAGIGATRNRGLELARGEYFLPMDADNVAHSDMVARLVQGLERNPDLAALSCYFLAFAENASPQETQYCYTPLGGPHVLGCLRNIYGDGNALFRSHDLRTIAGFTTDRTTSFEDWEVFVRLVNAGMKVDVCPEYLFHYRHRDSGWSRVTDDYCNRQRVLRQYVTNTHLPRSERLALWNLLAGLQHRVDELEASQRALQLQAQSFRHQTVDRLNDLVHRVPFVHSTLKWLSQPSRSA